VDLDGSNFVCAGGTHPQVRHRRYYADRRVADTRRCAHNYGTTVFANMVLQTCSCGADVGGPSVCSHSGVEPIKFGQQASTTLITKHWPSHRPDPDSQAGLEVVPLYNVQHPADVVHWILVLLDVYPSKNSNKQILYIM
jgi:hypothetical protein